MERLITLLAGPVNSEGEIVSVEVASEAAHWGGFTTWIQPHKPIWANTPSDIVSRLPDMPVFREEPIQVCGQLFDDKFRG